ncbi:MAG: hypothetical protein EP335_05775 [Alphaproteobacteria bacterium]|nr:MAG: hypothetical protein EP335_05775 [Alphaproteobacteria bacterium]
MDTRPYVFLLGGHDLEMQTIADLVTATRGRAALRDCGLSWGAGARAYEADIRALLAADDNIPVLVELADDLPADVPRDRLIFIDHHGARAGTANPSALRQVHTLLADAPAWSRWFDLVEANDIGHMRALRALGASAAEIRQVRDADRRAQGIGPADEAEARRAIAAARQRGSLTHVRTDSPSSSAIGDFIEPEYGGPGAENLLVETPVALNFFGAGHVIRALADVPGAWYGGALPARGYWGVNLVPGAARDTLVQTLLDLCGRAPQT